MKIFIDDAGGFNWANPGISLFCGVTVPERHFDGLIDRFRRWRRSIIGRSNRELKGSELTDAQLNSFATKVFLPSPKERDVCITVNAADTSRTRQAIVEQLRDQAAVMAIRGREIMQEHDNASMAEQYRQMSGWIKARSATNVYWMTVLHETIINSIQHTIIRFMEPEDDAEFSPFGIFIDESFIRRDEHISFWRDWLRETMLHKKEPTVIPDTWRVRSHPFIRNYEIQPGLFNLRQLFVEDMGFFRSVDVPGLQIADICAHILYRYHRGNGAKDAYGRLRLRLVARGGVELNTLLVDDSSLHRDDPRTHVGIFDIEEYKQKADALRASRQEHRIAGTDE